MQPQSSFLTFAIAFATFSTDSVDFLSTFATTSFLTVFSFTIIASYYFLSVDLIAFFSFSTLSTSFSSGDGTCGFLAFLAFFAFFAFFNLG